MIEHRTGDILQVKDAQVLVNPVNCAGRMGRGLALQFAQAYPDMERQYRQICRQKALRPGAVYLHPIAPPDQQPAWIASFPTKDHWRNPSRMPWIRDGMADLMAQMDSRGITSVAIPYLGAGLGGLNPDNVAQVIKEEAEQWPNIRTIIMSRRQS